MGNFSVTKNVTEIMVKGKRGQDVAFPLDTQCDCGAKIEIIINYMTECVVVELIKFIAAHDHLPW